MGPKVETPVTRCFLLFVLLPPGANDSSDRPSPLCACPLSRRDTGRLATMPVAKMLGKNEVFQAWTTSPYTKTLRHLLPYNRHWERRMTFRDPIVKSAKPKDRIKYWNIVPGDQVRIRGEESKTLYEVMSINKLSNQVRLKVPSSVSRSYNVCIFALY